MDIQKFNKETKVERSERIKREAFNRNKVILDPSSQTEHAVVDTIQDIRSKWRNRPVTESVNIYLSARVLRHDLWVDYISSTIKNRSMIGDVRFKDFICSCRHRYGINIEAAGKMLELSPDILTYIESGQYILIGDIAVSTSEKSANSRKYKKYYEIAKTIERSGYRVKHMNFIISEDLSNVHNTINKFVSSDIIVDNPKLTQRTIEFARSIQKAMDDIITSCIDKYDFQSRLDDIDKDKDEGTTGVIIPEEICNIDVTQVNPTMEEMEIINMCKIETDKLHADKFLDCDISQVNASFDKIINNNRLKEHMNPKATLKIVDNSINYEINSGYDLLKEYITDIQYNAHDDTVSTFILDLLPDLGQISKMSELYANTQLCKDKVEMQKCKKINVFGPFQYSRTKRSSSYLTTEINDKLSYGKKKRNIKKAPRTINPDVYDESLDIINKMILYYGSPSEKTPFLDDTWDAKTSFEQENSSNERSIYDRVRRTCGAQMAHSLSNLYQRITHLKTSLGSKDNIYIAPNASFIAVMPKEHAPISNKNCDIPFIFITRQRNGHYGPKISIEYEWSVKTINYTYYVSKLCRYNIDKIEHWDQAGYKLVASATCILSTCPELMIDFDKVVGLLSLLITDSHQKISEFLELVKYVSYMPFAEVSRLNSLIEDKFDLLIKTNFDVWMFKSLQKFINRLGNIDITQARKPKVQLYNSNVTRESLGLIMKLPSFISDRAMHKTIPNFIEEVNLLFTCRPKQLYGSQFIDKSLTNTAKWNNEYKDEIESYGSWATTGTPNSSGAPYPFNSKFCYCRDAIIYAQRLYRKEMPVTKKKVDMRMAMTKYDKYMHTNCSLRGCVKAKERRLNPQDIHTTSLEECLYQYSKKRYSDPECTVLGFTKDAILDHIQQEYAQSEKQQRGGGRPISTPDIFTKASLMAVEKPEQAIGELCSNNIIVPGKNKLKIQCETYKSLISEGVRDGKTQIYQLTEDQSKYSENDNTRKYESYIRNNDLLDPKVRAVQLQVLNKIIKRVHLTHRLPKELIDNKSISKYINNDRTGINVNIGWPQGMLNFISTSIHCIADVWITHAYNKAYPEDTVVTKGLVHSDDSWVTVACNSLDTFKKFSIFRYVAKKLFCLKVNDKKLWGSMLLGELVSNYNVNGNVHSSTIKILINCFNNLTYMNWVIDVHSQISSLQQMYRSGATLPIIILCGTILRQQIINSYRVDGLQLELINDIPIELGGYPLMSSFELAITGVSGHYNKLLEMIEIDSNSEPSVIILKALRLSLLSNLENELEGKDDIITREISKRTCISEIYSKHQVESTESKFDDIDYQSIIIPSRGEVFSCIKHIMPKSKKVSNTIKAISAIPFSGSGIEMIITDPKELRESLGNLKNQTSTLLYTLASDKYTTSSKRLAIAQSIQSTGKVVKIGKLPSMTINEMLTFLRTSNMLMAEIDNIRNAFIDDSSISNICNNIVYRGTYTLHNQDKRKIVNKQPETNDKFKTVTDLKSVLLYIIDNKYGTDYLHKYSRYDHHIDIIRQDSEMIKQRFKVLFSFYHTKYACNLIMQQYIYRVKSRLWMQPYLKTDNITTFLEDLYGKTINKDDNYSVSSDLTNLNVDDKSSVIINTIYTVSVLNHLYPNKFKIETFNNESVQDTIKKIDYAKLDNETFLKYAVLNILYMNNDSYMRQYDSRRIYDQSYIQTQKMINGKYQGKFICMVKYGKTVLKIEGEEKDVTIEANHNNINEILYAMMLFVQKNFSYYSYNHPNAWASCGFWECKMPFSKLFLTSYSSTVTCITSNKSFNSVPITLNNKIYMADTYNEINADRYIITDTLKDVYKVVGNDNIKVCHIRQNLSCPRLNDIQLVDDDIDGFMNSHLLIDKLIINLTLKRYYNCNRKQLLELLNTRITSLSAKPLLYFWINMVKKFKEVDVDIDEDSINDNVTTVTIDISDQCALAVISEGLITTAEDLTAIETNYVFSEEDRIGSLYRYDNLTFTIAKIITGHIDITEIEDIIYLLLKDRHFKIKIMEDVRSSSKEIEDKYNEINDDISLLPINVEVFALLVGTDMFRASKWSQINIVNIIGRKNVRTLNKNIFRYKEIIKNEIMLTIYDEFEDEIDDELIKYAMSI
uniref:RNA-directed RNA polymerase L n=1 Tax=Coleopteran phasma-related virus OKIAV236 TaxID=2746310 RepID=A0A7D7IK31_9VIRU|nr:RNA-dependent RNA polymerase [Coleopteran phasma-related virus OKIAV236]